LFLLFLTGRQAQGQQAAENLKFFHHRNSWRFQRDQVGSEICPRSLTRRVSRPVTISNK
jgi:hypothetical protein